jgi:hypothetical protein
MNTTENNKIIAEFMELPSINDEGQINYIKDLEHCPDYELSYHEDWSWLMEVIERIESLNFEVLIGRISCQINHVLDRENPISNFVCGNVSKKKEIVYETIIQFIKWHNEQKQLENEK